jgi:pyridoxamine 5'-phosphate oxidase
MNMTINFSEDTIDKDPFVQFTLWYNEYLTTNPGIPNAVSLATASSRGQVSVRTVLMKEFSHDGFVIFTNINSRKAMHLSANPKTALLFYWPVPGRQIRIEGTAALLTDDEASGYFSTRPRESQIGAWASEQSSVIPDRKHLENRYDLYKQIFENKPVEKPPHWGGYRIIPTWFEFWQNRDFRLHDRLTYTKRKEMWEIERLAP